MGNMGQRKGQRYQKRFIGKRRPSRKGRGVLGWLPDSIRPLSPAGKAAMSSWLGRSFTLSNPEASAEWTIGEDRVGDMRMMLDDTAGAIADGGTFPEIKIERPEHGYPLWGARIEMIVGGDLHSVEIESSSINDVMNRSIAWMNRSATK